MSRLWRTVRAGYKRSNVMHFVVWQGGGASIQLKDLTVVEVVPGGRLCGRQRLAVIQVGGGSSRSLRLNLLLAHLEQRISRLLVMPLNVVAMSLLLLSAARRSRTPTRIPQADFPAQMRLVPVHAILGEARAAASRSLALSSELVVCEVRLDDLLETLLKALALAIVESLEVLLLSLNHSLVLFLQEGIHARHRLKTQTILLRVRRYDDFRCQRPQRPLIHLMLES